MKLSPFCRLGEANFTGPLETVTVCGAVSMLVQVTLVPTLTVRAAGEYA